MLDRMQQGDVFESHEAQLEAAWRQVHRLRVGASDSLANAQEQIGGEHALGRAPLDCELAYVAGLRAQVGMLDRAIERFERQVHQARSRTLAYRSRYA